MAFDTPPEPANVDSPEQQKQLLSAHVRKLATGSVSLREVAELLDAEQFLTFNERTKGWNLDVERFIEDRIAKKSLLRFPEQITVLPGMVLPPDSRGIITGSGTGLEPKEVIFRSTFLMEVLTEMNLSYEIIEGNNNSRTMRQLSYKAFVLKSENKIVLINDEEGNATFVIFQAPGDLEEIKPILSLTKNHLKSMPNVEVVDYDNSGGKEDWKAKMKVILGQSEASAKNAPKPWGYWESASVEEISNDIRKRGLDPENLPAQIELVKGNAGLAAGLTRRFGGLTEARKALGGEAMRQPDGFWQNISLGDLRAEITRRGLDPNNLPSTDLLKEDHTDLLAGLRIRFGNLPDARKALGSKVFERPKGFWKKVSVEEVKKMLEEVGLDPKNLPPHGALQEKYPYLSIGLPRRFGTLAEARVELGGKSSKKPKGYWKKISIGDLRKEIKDRGFDPDNMPNTTELRENNQDMLLGLLKRFSSYESLKTALRNEYSES